MTFQWQPWVAAARPKTLLAGTAPVLLATALAYAQGQAQWIPALLAWGFAILAQIGANWVNDLADAEKGADHAGRIGPQRMVASGRITPQAMRKAVGGIFTLAFMVGCGLIPFGGLPLIGVGLASFLAAYLYSSGPFPLAYLGLGDVLDIIFFGFVATVGAYYVQTGQTSGPIWLVALGIGCVINNILVVNNARDRESDALVNKKTVAVRFGRGFCFFLYRTSSLIGLMVGPFLWMSGRFSAVVCLPCLLYPMLWKAQSAFLRAQSASDWGKVFGLTVKFMALYALLLSIGLVLTRFLS